MADPDLTKFDCGELGQYIYEDGTQCHRRLTHELFRPDKGRLLKPEFMEKRRGLGNILGCATPPLHDCEGRRQRVHLRQLDVAITGEVALDSGIRYGIPPLYRASGIGAGRHGTSNAAVIYLYAQIKRQGIRLGSQ